MKRFVARLLVMTLIVGFSAVAVAGLVSERVEAAESAEATESATQTFSSEGPALMFDWVEFVGPDISSS